MLADIRRALARPAPPDHHYPEVLRPTSAPASATPEELFEARFKALGGHWHIVRDAADIVQAVDSIAAAKAGLVWVARDAAGRLDGLGLADSLTAVGYRVIRSLASETDRDAISLTITTSTAGIADSGSFGLLAEPGQGRLASLIAPIHLVVLHRSQIIATLGEFLRTAEIALRSGSTSAAVLITGPSRTADIEGQLIVGVHGPGEIHCALVG